MKRLFEVEIEDIMYVMAEDSAHAEDVARRHINECDLDVSAYEANSYYGTWANAHPYNQDDNDNRTLSEIVAEIIAEQKKQAYIKKHYRKLPFKIRKEKIDD